MNYIINFLSTVLGHLMNVFYLLFDFIGTPYIWMCIVLFSLVTRFFFLPDKIKAARKKKLNKVIESEVADVHYRYLNSEETKENKKAQKREVRAIYKKYRVSQGSGCLSALLQLPIYIALYNVVVSPHLYVPEIKKLYIDTVGNADMIATIHNFLGLDVDLTPLNLGLAAYIFPLFVCLFVINRSRKTLKGQKLSGPKKNFFRWYTISLLTLQVVMLTCLSFKLPLGISIYWLANDVVNLTIDYFIARGINKDKKIKAALDAYEEKLLQKQAAEETKDNEASEKQSSLCSTNVSNETDLLHDESVRSEEVKE